MPDPTNSQIADALDELGDLYELDGAIVHRVVAYRNAAKAVREAPVSVLGLARTGRATELPAVGATIQERVVAVLPELPASDRVELGGSARRMTDSVKDLDVIATAHDPEELARAAASLELIESTGTPSEAGVRMVTHTAIPIDLKIVAPD